MQRNKSDKNCLSNTSIPQLIKQSKGSKTKKKYNNTSLDLLAWCDTAAQMLQTCKSKNENKTNMAVTQWLLRALLKHNQHEKSIKKTKQNRTKNIHVTNTAFKPQQHSLDLSMTEKWSQCKLDISGHTKHRQPLRFFFLCETELYLNILSSHSIHLIPQLIWGKRKCLRTWHE